MSLLERAAYRALYRAWLSRLDPERAHQLAVTAVAAFGRHTPVQPYRDWRLQVRKRGLTFPNPIGLAAGVDKDARAIVGWVRLGFGLVEVGTVTPRQQPGNPPPRLFRLPADRALINRLGFPSAGAAQVRSTLLATPPVSAPIGLNISKNADTSLDQAAEDYVTALTMLAGVGDYAVINVSSPNTVGLRDLQAAPSLRELCLALRPVAERAGRQGGRLPLLLKIAPDLTDEQLADIVGVVRSTELDGVITTNSTIARPDLTSAAAGESGGLSGPPLRARSTALVAELRRELGPEPLIIGVGGVSTVEDVWEKLRSGADVIQLYTALIYEGPELPSRLARGLTALLAREGVVSLTQPAG